jgi:hypothetical protein
MRRRFKQTTTLEYRLAQQAEQSRQEAEGTPAGIERDKLIRRARQADTALRINAWIYSKGLRSPT